MKRFLLLIGIVLIAPTFAADSDKRSEYRTPQLGWRLIARSDGGRNGSFAKFKGRVTLSGVLAIGFDRSPEGKSTDEQDTEGDAVFFPDEQSRSKLPYAVGNYYPGEVEKIFLYNKPSSLLPGIVGANRSTEILHGNMPRYDIQAEITIFEFTSWVECDHRGYSAKVVNARSPNGNPVANSDGGIIGC